MILTVNGLSDMENGIMYINRNSVRIQTTMMDQGLYDQYICMGPYWVEETGQ